MAKYPQTAEGSSEERKAELRKLCAPNWMEHPQLAWHWEVSLSDLSPSAKSTALALWGFTRADNLSARPAISTLSLLTGFKDRSTTQHLAEIDKAGFIRRDIGGGKFATRYYLQLPQHVIDANLAATSPKGSAPKCTSAASRVGSNETLYLIERRDDHDLPTEEYCRERFSELQKKIAKVDKNGILSRFLWHEKGFIGFTKLGDQHGFEEVMSVAISVAVRENSRCVKEKGSIKTWGYFKNDMVKELDSCNDWSSNSYGGIDL